jgi:hypothetical protein
MVVNGAEEPEPEIPRGVLTEDLACVARILGKSSCEQSVDR